MSSSNKIIWDKNKSKNNSVWSNTVTASSKVALAKTQEEKKKALGELGNTTSKSTSKSKSASSGTWDKSITKRMDAALIGGKGGMANDTPSKSHIKPTSKSSENLYEKIHTPTFSSGYNGYKGYQSGTSGRRVFTPSAVLRDKKTVFDRDTFGHSIEKKRFVPSSDIWDSGKSFKVKTNRNTVTSFDDYLIQMARTYREINKNAKTPYERSKLVNRLLNENKDIIDTYNRTSGGKTFNIADISEEYNEDKILRKGLDRKYNMTLADYYKDISNPDFAKFSQSVNNDDIYTKSLSDKLKPGFNKNAFKTTMAHRVNKAFNSPVANREMYEGSVDTSVPFYSPETGAVTYYDMQNPDDAKLLYMKPEEKQIYNYQLAKYGQEAADKFLDYLSGTLDERYVKAYAKNREEFANKHKILGAGENIISQFRQPAAAIDAASQTIDQNRAIKRGGAGYKPYNPYTQATLGVHEQNATEQGITRDMSGAGKTVTDFGLSLGQNVARLPLGTYGLPIMAAGVMGNTAVDAGMRGQTDAGKAAKLGAACGAVEYATEKLPLEQLLRVMKSPPSTIRGFVTQILKNSATEFGEESISNIADNIADKIIMQDKSEYEAYKKNLISQGKTPEQAERETFNKFFIQDTFISGAQGAASGAILGTGAAALGTAVNNYNYTVNTGREYKSVGAEQELISEGLRSKNDTQAYKYADKLQNKQNLSDWNVGRQVQKNMSAIDAENKQGRAFADITGVQNEAVDRLKYNANGATITNTDGSNRVLISDNRQVAKPETLMHEYTHILKQLASEQFRKYEDYVNSVIRLSNMAYENGEINEETAAIIAEKFTPTAEQIEKVLAGDYTIADRMLDVIDALSARLKDSVGKTQSTRFGGEITNMELRQARKLWNDALKTAAENKGAAMNSTGGTTTTKYSPIEYDSEGKAYVRIENNILDGIPKNQWSKAVSKWLNQNIQGREFMAQSDGESIKATRKFTNEYGRGSKSKNIPDEQYKAKMNLAGNIDEAIMISDKQYSAEDNRNVDGTLKHGNFAKYGWDYRTFNFEYNGKRYSGKLNVAKNDNGHLAYDVTNIKEADPHSGSRYNSEDTRVGGSTSFDNSVSQTKPKVKYSFAGENSKTADLEALKIAKQMEKDGADPETIWKETGWGRGLDGKWRYEIDDSKMKFKGSTSELQKLSDVLDYEELYQAYPDIKDISIQEVKDPNFGGAYSERDDIIYLNEDLTPAQKKATLAHELQHAIQKREGFARGGNLLIQGDDFYNTAGEIEAYDAKARVNMNSEEQRTTFPDSMKKRDKPAIIFDRNNMNMIDLLADNEYRKAIEKGDMDKAGNTVRTYAKAKGYQMYEYDDNGTAKYVYRDGEGSEKSADTITYDDKGNIISLPRRFNNEKSDIRFSLNENTEEHTPEQLKIMQEYEDAVDENLLDFVQYAKEHKNDNRTNVTLSEVSERGAKDIRNLTGIDVTGYEHNLKVNTINHIENRHGINGDADHSMADDNDIARIQYVLDNYDNVELLDETSREFKNKDNMQAPMIRYSKRIDGTYYAVEAVPDTKAHKLQIVTAYKNKAAQQVRDAQNPNAHVRNEPADTAYNNTVSQDSGNVKKKAVIRLKASKPLKQEAT